MNTSIVSVRGATKVYGEQRAVDDIELEVAPGTIVGLIGPSGCGKTTLVRLLTGITAPTEGTVEVFGIEATRLGVRDRRRFGYMPQLPVLFPNLTVWGNLNFIASVYGVPTRRRRAHLRSLLDLVDLGPHAGKQLADCSGGMQRRLTLAATLVHGPELLYLDEPTAGVDPILRNRFWEHFRALRDRGSTLIVPTQYVSEAVSCDVVAIMRDGKLLTVQRPDDLARYAYGGDPIAITVDGRLSRADLAQLSEAPFVRDVRFTERGLLVLVDDAERDVLPLQQALDAIGPMAAISPVEISYDDIFVEIMERHEGLDDAAQAA